jgi:omega-6 fatty acid desaturase (delta-12 desaturase)
MDTNTNTNTNKINETDLFTKYKSSYISSFCDLSINLSLLCFGNYVLYLYKESYFVYLFIPFMSLLNIKTFMSFHDCNHESYTPNKTINYLIGTVSGIITVTTSMNWGLDHRTHHLTNGNVTNKYNYSFNETTRITYKQYSRFNWLSRVIIKCLLYPVIQFAITPIIYFVFIQRFIYIVKKLKYKSKIESSMALICFNHFIHNVGTIGLCYFTNKLGYLHLFILYVYFSQILGYLLFFNQHTFNPPYIVNNEEWTQRDSGLIGSSFIQIPWYLKYFFSGIEYHHIHHMNAKIPGYNLQKYHEEVVQNSNMFDNIVKLSMDDCYNNLWLVMYDEDNKKFITFEEADKQMEESKSK